MSFINKLKQFWKINCIFNFHPFLVIAWYMRFDERLINNLKFLPDQMVKTLDASKSHTESDCKDLSNHHKRFFREAYNVRKLNYNNCTLDQVMRNLTLFELIRASCRQDHIGNQETVVVISGEVLYDKIIELVLKYKGSFGNMHILQCNFENMEPTMFLIKEVYGFTPTLEIMSTFVFDVN